MDNRNGFKEGGFGDVKSSLNSSFGFKRNDLSEESNCFLENSFSPFPGNFDDIPGKRSDWKNGAYKRNQIETQFFPQPFGALKNDFANSQKIKKIAKWNSVTDFLPVFTYF